MSSVPAHPDLSTRSAVTPDGQAPAAPESLAAADDSVERRVARVFGDRSHGSRRRWVPVLAVVAALALVAGAAWFLRSGDASADRYVTATATTADVAARLQNVASIVPVSQAAVAFPVAGTVSTVDVAVGDTVVVGQQLAALDTTALADTLHEKEADLADARLTLQRALDGESTTSTQGGAGSSAAPGSATAPAATTSATTTATQSSGSNIALASVTARTATDRSQVSAAQQAVVAAQQQVDAALAAADAAMASAASVCASSGSAGATSTSTTTTTPTTSTPAAGEFSDACVAGLQAVQTAQQQVATAQQQLATASTVLDGLLAAEAAAGSSGGTSAGSSAGTSTPTGSAGATSPATSTASSSPSAARLVADQQAVDAAEAAVAVAQQSVAQAFIHSPIAGTVVAVALTRGATVAAGSSTATVTVQGDQGVEVVTSVALDQVASVAVGQAATVVADGSHRELQGKVVAVSTVPTSSTTSTTFQVTVGLDDPGADLGNGGTGTVTIITASASRSLTVPTSAVRVNGTRHSVVVLDGSTTSTRQVQVGVVGAERTEITGGLSSGDVIVLADRDESLPNSATSGSGATSGPGASGSGGFPAGGPGAFSGRGGPPGAGGN